MEEARPSYGRASFSSVARPTNPHKENEEELEKLKFWFKKIEKRDFLGAPLRKATLEKLKACEKVFEAFAHRVYEFQKTL